MAAMSCFADAAGMRRGGCRQGQRGEGSHERHEHEEFGGQLLGDQSLCDQSLHAGFAMVGAYQLAVGESKKAARLPVGEESLSCGQR
jgi:hypothetical protein